MMKNDYNFNAEVKSTDDRWIRDEERKENVYIGLRETSMPPSGKSWRE